MKYSDMRQNLKTGDIVLFGGRGLISTGIKWLTRSKYSHVGMVLNLPVHDMSNLPVSNVVLLWESTTLSKISDVVSGRARRGVQLVPLSERIKSYNGDIIAVRPLQYAKFNAEQMLRLHKLRHNVAGRPYEQSKIELLRSAIDIGPDQPEDLSSLFCSELVAEAYQEMGLLSSIKPSNEYTPRDFSSEGSEPLYLYRGAKLGQEVIIEK